MFNPAHNLTSIDLIDNTQQRVSYGVIGTTNQKFDDMCYFVVSNGGNGICAKMFNLSYILFNNV